MWKKATPSVILFLLLLGLLLSGCSEKPLSNAELWQAAMTDAVFSEDEEVVELVTLTEDDPDVIWDEAGERVLLVSWHNYDAECSPGSSIPQEYGEIWATSLGEMLSWYTGSSSGVDDWQLRFAQLLGVHEDEGYTRFSAFWVAPADVIRPAYITDATKQMINDYTLVTDETYKQWFDQNILWSYFTSDYPWTRLGYTYDWSGGESEYGLSEFLIYDGSKTEIEFTYTTEEFVDWLEQQTDNDD